MSANEETFSQGPIIPSIDKHRKLVGGVLRDVFDPLREFGEYALYLIGIKSQIGKNQVEQINAYIAFRARHNDEFQRILPSGELNIVTPHGDAANDSSFYNNIPQKPQSQKAA